MKEWCGAFLNKELADTWARNKNKENKHECLPSDLIILQNEKKKRFILLFQETGIIQSSYIGVKVPLACGTPLLFFVTLYIFLKHNDCYLMELT